jgi:methyl-accepting chemotaxis protein
MSRAIRFGVRRWINQVPVGRRAVAAVGVLLGLVVVTIGLSAAFVFHQHEAQGQLDDHAVPLSSAVSAASLNAKGAANDERGFLLTGDQVYLSELDKRVGAARDSFDRASTSAIGDEVGYVEHARAGFERWVTALDAEFALFRNGERSAAVQAAVGANRDLRKSYEAALADAQRSADQAVDQDEGAVNDASSWGWVVLAFLVMALIGGCFIATWLVRSVIIPLNTLANLLGRAGR